VTEKPTEQKPVNPAAWEPVDPAVIQALRNELDQTKKELFAAKGRAAKAEKAASKTSKTENTNPKPAEPIRDEAVPQDSHSHEEGKPHFIGSWQRYCPTCGDQNPEFKDETVCEDCGTHLGAKQIVEKLKACPNCGGTRAKAIK
jgi:hypothetical protein